MKTEPKRQPNAAEIAAVAAILAVLSDLASDTRRRVLMAALVILGNDAMLDALRGVR